MKSDLYVKELAAEACEFEAVLAEARGNFQASGKALAKHQVRVCESTAAALSSAEFMARHKFIAYPHKNQAFKIVNDAWKSFHSDVMMLTQVSGSKVMQCGVADLFFICQFSKPFLTELSSMGVAFQSKGSKWLWCKWRLTK